MDSRPQFSFLGFNPPPQNFFGGAIFPPVIVCPQFWGIPPPFGGGGGGGGPQPEKLGRFGGWVEKKKKKPNFGVYGARH